MTKMIIVTPSFAPDFELCANLHKSILDYTPDSVCHHIIVPRRDLELFGKLAGPRARIRCEADLLPRTFVKLPLTKFTCNLRHPFPPVRGWILQQIVKLAAAAAAEEDVVILVDSDIEFVRPFTAETFYRDGTIRFFRKAHQIDERLARHIIWHQAARELLGLPVPKPPFTDYISSLLAWDPVAVRKMLARVSATTGLPWTSAIGRRLHFSEWILYGVFVDEVIGEPAFASSTTLCLDYWTPTPLTIEEASKFGRGLQPSDVAAMISAKSRTSPEVRRAAFASVRAAARAQSDGSAQG